MNDVNAIAWVVREAFMICLDSLLLIAPLFGLENCCKSIFDGETREKSFPEALVHNYSSCFSGVPQKRRPIAYLSTWNNLQWVKLPEKSWMRCFSVSVSCQQFLHSHVNLSLSKRGKRIALRQCFDFSIPYCDAFWCAKKYSVHQSQLLIALKNVVNY